MLYWSNRQHDAARGPRPGGEIVAAAAERTLADVPAARKYFDEYLPQFSGFISDAALASVIRSIERVSVEALDAQAKAVGLAGSMPRAFVSPLEPLPPLDDLLYVGDEENWRRAILQEEFASAVECPVEDMYAQEFVAAPSEA